MKQIKIENNGVEQLITVPENSKVTIDGNVVVFEPKFEKAIRFKKGDIAITNMDGISIIGNKSDGTLFFSIALFSQFNLRIFKFDFTVRPKRLATDHEKQLLFNALEKEGKQWNAEKLCIEDLKVVPKVGDCVKFIYHDNDMYFGRVSSIKGKYNPEIKTFSYLNNERGKLDFVNEEGAFILYDSFKILKKQQFQSELLQLGFEYNFENDTISELKWKPKEDDICYLIIKNYDTFGYSKIKYAKALGDALRNGHLFKTPELCQQAIDKIKQVLSEK